MSWLTRLDKVKLEIITGDGKSYKPLWRQAQKNIQYNTEGFDFVGIEGTYVERQKQKGRQFPINFIFKGEDCIDVSNAFEESAKDSRPWKIKHPFYDDLTVQPISLSFNNSDYNLVRITGVVWETIDTKFPQEIILPKKLIENTKAIADIQSKTAFVSNIQDPSILFTQTAQISVASIEKNYTNLAVLEEDIKIFKDLARTASGAAQNVLSDVNSFLQSTINLINFPLQITQNIETKIQKIKDSFNELLDVLDFTKDEDKALYETLGSTTVSELAEVLVNPQDGDYETRSEVLLAFEDLNTLYTNLLTNFDDNEFIQNSELAIQMDIIVNLALANLYEIGFQAKQERTILTEKNNNMVNLAHRYYGPGDDNLTTFINQNSITLSEHLLIKKGREIIYYV